MPAVFDEILDVLSDGEYHTFEEITFKAARNLNKTQVEEVLQFLDSYGFIEQKRSRSSAFGPLETKGAKLSRSMTQWLKQIKELESTEDEEEREARNGIAQEMET